MESISCYLFNATGFKESKAPISFNNMITLRFNKVKARKEHVCNFCCERIERDDHYYNSAHMYDGSVYTWKSHENCSKLLTELEMDGDEGITQEGFWEDVKNKYNDLTVDDEVGLEEPNFKQMLDYVIIKTIGAGDKELVDKMKKLAPVLRPINQFDKR